MTWLDMMGGAKPAPVKQEKPKLPFVGLEHLKGEGAVPCGIVFVHESGKTAQYMNEELPEDHPEYGFLSSGPHLGLARGVDCVPEMDFGPINSNPSITDVIYVADNDDAGRGVAKDFHKRVKKVSYTLELRYPFAPGADLGDPYPDHPLVGRLATRVEIDAWLDEDGGKRIRAHMMPLLHFYWEEKVLFINARLATVEIANSNINGKLGNRCSSNNIRRLIERDRRGADIKGRKMFLGPFKTRTGLWEGGSFPLIEAPDGLYINQYEPSRIIPQKGDLRPWRSFLENHFEVESERLDFLRWFYGKLARPWVKPAWAVMLFSEKKGTGKSTLCQGIIAKLIGEKHYHEMSEASLKKEFTPNYRDKLMLVIDDIKEKGEVAKAKIKQAVSNTIVAQELKGKDQEGYVEFQGNIIGSGNETDAMRKEPGERRLWKPRCTELKISDKDTGECWEAPDGFDADYWMHPREHFHPYLEREGLAAILYEALNQKDGFYVEHMEEAPKTARGEEDAQDSIDTDTQYAVALAEKLMSIEGGAINERAFIDRVRMMSGKGALDRDEYIKDKCRGIRNLVRREVGVTVISYSDGRLRPFTIDGIRQYVYANGNVRVTDDVCRSTLAKLKEPSRAPESDAEPIEESRPVPTEPGAEFVESTQPDTDVPDDIRRDVRKAMRAARARHSRPQDDDAPQDPRLKSKPDDFSFLVHCVEAAEDAGIPLDGEYERRLLREVQAIEERGFVDYFLVAEEAVSWARRRMFVAPGRGSAAGSLVAYCLGITEIDPVEHGLLFERFMAPGRPDAPDIDVDFSDRAAVVEHLRAVYGEGSVVKLINKHNYKAKSAIDKIVDDCGLDPGLKKRVRVIVLDDIKRSGGELRVVEALKRKRAGLSLLEEHPELARIDELEGQKRGLALHGSKVAIVPAGADPRSLERWTEYTKRDGETVSGLLAKDETELPDGYVVLDALSSPALARLSDAANSAGVSYEELKSCGGDERAAYEVLNDGRLTEVFQYCQSVGRKLARRFHRHESFSDVVAFVSLARPETLKSGACDLWVERRLNESSRPDMHPLIESILGSTFGVIVYQEQVMKLLRLGDVSWENVSILRKKTAVAGANADELMDEYAPGWADVMIAKGIPEWEVQALSDEMRARGGYGFNLSHATSYGSTSLRMAWMKAYHPAHFAAAFLNGAGSKSDAMSLALAFENEGVEFGDVDFDGEALDWRAFGGKVMPPLWACEGLTKTDARSIVKERAAGRPLNAKLTVKLGKAASLEKKAASSVAPPRGG